TVDEHGAGAALRQPASELRAIELEVVAKHVKQRRVRLGRNRTAHAIDFDVGGHAWRLPQTPGPQANPGRLFFFRAVLFCADAGAASSPCWRGSLARPSITTPGRAPSFRGWPRRNPQTYPR